MSRSNHEMRRVLGRVRRDEFVGRSDELAQLVSHGSRSENRGLVVLAAPAAGASELLRQTYDEIWRLRSLSVPVYFALPKDNTTPVSAAIEFLNTFLLQYLAFRRDEPVPCPSSLTLDELVQLTPDTDRDWVEKLVNQYKQQRFGRDDSELIRLCLTAPRRIPRRNGHAFIMFDGMSLPAYDESDIGFEKEIVRALTFCNQPFALAGLRREVLSTVENAVGNSVNFERVYLNRLADQDGRDLIRSSAQRLGVAITDETRDLFVHQLEGSPFFFNAVMKAAQEKNLSLDSYFACERLYVDELLGGRLNRWFSSRLDRIVPDPENKRAVISLLCEAPSRGQMTVRSWRRRLGLGSEMNGILATLHAEELINWDGESIDTGGSPTPWKDYLRSRFRLDVLQEPRALVVADLMAGALKRAPQTVARHFRRAAGLRLRELLERFNFQLVPRQLFYYDQFARSFKGATPDEAATGIASDSDLLRLPQVFHSASGVSFGGELRKFGEEVSVVSHSFDGDTYTDANEVVWLAARVESKLAVEREVAAAWCDRLEALARSSGFIRTQTWLISNEGFSDEACEMLRARSVFFSSQQQFELLAGRLGAEGVLPASGDSDEIELVLPMGSDYELLAASTVEQLARRLEFRPEAINQIKTAMVEACINASEHSLSPDRKIYQRFRVENDKLVITISSRGIVPADLNAREAELSEDADHLVEHRRGWGLKLIRTLMDEVEFQRVDEGTSLRMTKYVRK
jgi:serine/threonine-protein kinase RsbW